ncbi:4'-phosphopantetheinyl transferase family protein [Dyella silvatica]|uniref:4'-phosphopantetheinyl transferase family protein n=1 Tax=Dyella silvatica TaxID=2992128 RepID=UPI00224CC710|nr:4'-phosphopantetheinyl transferase superfamily protein [Dyella silvatica]
MSDPATPPTTAPPWASLSSDTLLHQQLGLPGAAGLSCQALSVLEQQGLACPPLPASLDRAVRKRQREYLTGRLCACSALRKAGYPHDIYPAMKEDRLPAWPDGWLGSISHSGDYAMAVAAAQTRCHALGIDIQQRVALKVLMDIQSMIAQPTELTQLGELDVTARLLLIFSGKESLYKALYPQVRQIKEFDAAELVYADAQTLQFRLTHDWSDRWKADSRISVRYVVFDEYVVTATCLSGDHSTD